MARHCRYELGEAQQRMGLDQTWKLERVSEAGWVIRYLASLVFLFNNHHPRYTMPLLAFTCVQETALHCEVVSSIVLAFSGTLL